MRGYVTLLPRAGLTEFPSPCRADKSLRAEDVRTARGLLATAGAGLPLRAVCRDAAGGARMPARGQRRRECANPRRAALSGEEEAAEAGGEGGVR
jgi:hypothetical protein